MPERVNLFCEITKLLVLLYTSLPVSSKIKTLLSDVNWKGILILLCPYRAYVYLMLSVGDAHGRGGPYRAKYCTRKGIRKTKKPLKTRAKSFVNGYNWMVATLLLICPKERPIKAYFLDYSLFIF
jgi:hypothetical protein